MARAALILTATLLVAAAAGQVPGPTGPSPRPELVSVRLAADRTAVTPGKSFRLGVLFEIAEDWHIYWKNPGDAGLATDVSFKLPDGWDVGELRWPTPTRFTQSGNIAGYGYKGSVLLWAEVTPPKKLPGEAVTLRAEVAWLACRRDCIAGDATPSLRLPVGKGSRGEDLKRFETFSARLPAPAKSSPLLKDVQSRVETPERGVSWRFDLELKRKPASADLFPFVSGNAFIKKAELVGDGRDLTVVIRATRTGKSTTRTRAEAVLVLTNAEGRREAILLSAPAKSSTPAEDKPSADSQGD